MKRKTSSGEHRGFLTVLFFTLSFLFSTNLLALNIEDNPQEPSGDSFRGLHIEGPLVTAARLPSFQIPFANTPGNVSYIAANVTEKDKREIQATHPATLQESLSDTEGAVFYDAVGNGLDTVFSMRGFTSSSDVVVLLDGVRINEVDGNNVVFPLLRMNDMESIQIDRGSASHIYGDGAFAGVLHLTTGQPSEKPLSLFGGFEVSSHHGIRFHQGFSGTLEDEISGLGGKWGYYFNGSRDVGDGFRDNGEYRITSFDMKSTYEFADERGRAHIGLKHVDDAVSNSGEMTVAEFNADPEQTNKPLDGRKFKSTILQMGSDFNFWDGRVTASIFNSLRTNLTQFFSTSGTFTDFTTGSNPDTDYVTTKARSNDLIWQISYIDEWRKNLRNMTFFGMEFRDGSEFTVEKDAFGGHVNNSAAVETERDSDTYNTGLFWRQTFELFEKWVPFFGMRYDWHWLKSEDAVTPSDSISRRWKASTLSAGLTYHPVESTDFFFNYSQGFRVPTISEIAPFSGTVSTGLEPVETDSYEIGGRFRYQDLARLKSSFFLIDLENEIVFDSTTTGPTAPFGQNINVGKTRRMGVEVRLDLQPVKEVNLYGSYTWTRAWNRATNPSGSLPNGRSQGLVPEHRGTWGISVRPFLRAGYLWDGFRVMLNGTYTGSQHPQSYESASQTILNATGGAGHKIKAYTLWNFQISYEWKEIEIYFKINNLFDNKYYSRSVSATSFGTAVYPAGTYTFVNPGAPREYYGGLRWKIG